MQRTAVLVGIVFALLLTPVYPLYAFEPGSTQSAQSTLLMRKALAATREGQPKPPKEPLQNMQREKMATREGLMRQRLALFRNQEKAQIAQKVTTNLNQVNQNYTTAMLNHLSNLSQILVKLEARLIQAPANTDTTVAATNISMAKDKISSASSILNLQLEKDYSIDATSESTLKSDIMAGRVQLRSDLQANKELIMAARQSVLVAIETVAKTIGGNNGSR